MKRVVTLLLAVCLLAALAMPTMAAKVDFNQMAETAINELAKYNSTPVGEKFNNQTMMGYVFGNLCAGDDTSNPVNPYYQAGSNAYDRYMIPADVCEAAFTAAFADAKSALIHMQNNLKYDEFSREYNSVQKNVLKAYDGSNYYFSKYLLNRTQLSENVPAIKSGKGYVIETAVPVWTVNGYEAAGNYTYKVYATNDSNAVVEYTVKYTGQDIQFVSTKAVSAVPDTVVKPGTEEDLTAPTGDVTTTTTTTTTGTTTTTTTGGGVATRPTQAEQNVTGDTQTNDNTTLYIIIAAVLGVVIVGVITAVVIVAVKLKKKSNG